MDKLKYLERFIATLLCVFITCHFVHGQDADDIIFEIADDTVRDFYIGNIVNRANLDMQYTPSELRNLSYVFLSDGIHKDLFQLDNKTGELQTKMDIDRDELCPGDAFCLFEIDIAIQPAKYFMKLNAVIRIKDRNDHTPQFSQNTVRYEILESTPAGVIAPVMTATDPDSPGFGVSRYKLRGNTDTFGISVRNESGTYDLQLVLKTALDRELENSYILKVLACDGGSPSLTGTLTLEVHILDINDNRPIFENSVNEVSVPENLNTGSEIITVLATDMDLSQNGHVTYEFHSDTLADINYLFSIDQNSGVITLEQTLDFETRQSYILVVVAKDAGPDSLPTSARVVVHVNDVNDNPPQILNNTLPADGVVRIDENNEQSAFVAHISVIDLDSESNGQVACFIHGHEGRFDMIEIYEKEFKIIAIGPLDYEQKTTYNLRIRCQDYGIPQFTTEEDLLIQVQDMNDNAPVFGQSTYHVTLVENNRPDTSLLRVRAYDPDTGSGGQVRYKIKPDMADKFDVDIFSGDIRVIKSLDREEAAVVEFEVIAFDSGTPSLSSVAMVAIELTDVNDDVPHFVSRIFYLNITENMNPRTEVGVVTAIDGDLPPNNGLFYLLDQQHSAVDTFTIDPVSGVIHTKRRLDREKQDEYSLTVLVQSENSPNEEDTAVVFVRVLDENDNAPNITFPRQTPHNSVNVSNLAPIGYRVTRIMASDPDTGINAELEYEIFEGNNDGLFQLEKTTGFLVTSRDLSMFDQEQMALTIMVNDRGTSPLMTVATLHIFINSSAPVHETRVSESHNNAQNNGEDNMAAVVAGVCSAIIILLVLILIVILLLRRRNKQRDSRRPLYSAQPSSPIKDDVIDFRAGQTQINEGCKTDQYSPKSNDTSIPIKISFGQAALDGCVTSQNKTTGNVASPSGKPSFQMNGGGRIGRYGDERDNDSGCADLSQGSSEENNIQGASLMKPRTNQANKTSHESGNGIKMKALPPQPNHRMDIGNNQSVDIRHATIERTKNIGDRHKQQDLVRSRSVEPRGFGEPLGNPHMTSPASVQFNPHMHATRTPSPLLLEFSPTRNPSFAEWLQNENRQLKTQGHRYNVNGLSNTNPITSGITDRRPSLPKAAKTVRFTEPLPSPPSEMADIGDMSEIATTSPPPICIRASYGGNDNQRFVLDLTNTDATSGGVIGNRGHPVVRYPHDSYPSPEDEDGSLV